MDAKPILPGPHALLSHDEQALEPTRGAPDSSFTPPSNSPSHSDGCPDHADIKGVRLVALSDETGQHMSHGNNRRVYWIRDHQKVIIGRAPQRDGSRQLAPNSYALPCPVMSKEHAVIEFRDASVCLTDSNSHHGTWLLNSTDGIERLQQQHIVRDGDSFAFGKSVEKNGQLYHPPTVSVKFVYSDTFPSEEVETAVSCDGASQGNQQSNRYGILCDEFSDVESIHNSADHPSGHISFIEDFLPALDDGLEAPLGTPPWYSPSRTPRDSGSPRYTPPDVDCVAVKPVSSIHDLLHHDYNYVPEPELELEPEPAQYIHSEDMEESDMASDDENSDYSGSGCGLGSPLSSCVEHALAEKIQDIEKFALRCSHSERSTEETKKSDAEKRIADLEEKVAQVRAEVKSALEDNQMVIQEMEDDRSELLRELEHLRADAVDMKLDDISGILLDVKRIAAEHQSKLDAHLKSVSEKEAAAAGSPTKMTRKRVIDELDLFEDSEDATDSHPAALHIEASAQVDPFDALSSIEHDVPKVVVIPPPHSQDPQPSAREAPSNGMIIDASTGHDRAADGPPPSKRARIEIVIPSTAGVLAGAVAGGILTWAGLAYT